jgi:hypothetical protein
MNPDPLRVNDQPMKYADALIVAAVLTICLCATVFYPTHTYDAYIADPNRYAFELAWFIIGGYFTEFAALTGLTYLAKRSASGDGKGET